MNWISFSPLARVSDHISAQSWINNTRHVLTRCSESSITDTSLKIISQLVIKTSKSDNYFSPIDSLLKNLHATQKKSAQNNQKKYLRCWSLQMAKFCDGKFDLIFGENKVLSPPQQDTIKIGLNVEYENSWAVRFETRIPFHCRCVTLCSATSLLLL